MHQSAGGGSSFRPGVAATAPPRSPRFAMLGRAVTWALVLAMLAVAVATVLLLPDLARHIKR
jgi:hypothetical protein